MITKVAPGKGIRAHKDVLGAYAHYYTRYHVVLQGFEGSIFACGDEQVCMRTGEVWWFNANEMHEIKNASGEDRVHLLIDLRVQSDRQPKQKEETA
jgi:hypothetical protein